MDSDLLLVIVTYFDQAGIDTMQLKCQALIARAFLSQHLQKTANALEVFESLGGLKEAYSELLMVVRVVLILPLTTCSNERIFSVLTFVKDNDGKRATFAFAAYILWESCSEGAWFWEACRRLRKNEAKEIFNAEITVRKFLIYTVNVPFWYCFWSLNKLQSANPKGITVLKGILENLEIFKAGWGPKIDIWPP